MRISRIAKRVSFVSLALSQYGCQEAGFLGLGTSSPKKETISPKEDESQRNRAPDQGGTPAVPKNAEAGKPGGENVANNEKPVPGSENFLPYKPENEVRGGSSGTASGNGNGSTTNGSTTNGSGSNSTGAAGTGGNGAANSTSGNAGTVSGGTGSGSGLVTGNSGKPNEGLPGTGTNTTIGSGGSNQSSGNATSGTNGSGNVTSGSNSGSGTVSGNQSSGNPNEGFPPNMSSSNSGSGQNMAGSNATQTNMTGGNSGSNTAGQNSTGTGGGSNTTGAASTTGNPNEGFPNNVTGGNSGSVNTGGNSGSVNTGGNSGSVNTGGNSGSVNTGGNSGSVNTGGNSGSVNTGGNSGSASTGGNNTNRPNEDFPGNNGGKTTTGNFGNGNTGTMNTGGNSGISNNGTGNFSNNNGGQNGTRNEPPKPPYPPPPGKVWLELTVIQAVHESWWKNCLWVAVEGTQDWKKIACNKEADANGKVVFLLANARPACNKLQVWVETYHNQGNICNIRMQQGLPCEGPYAPPGKMDYSRNPLFPHEALFYRIYDRVTVKNPDPLIRSNANWEIPDFNKLSDAMGEFRGADGSNKWLRVFFEDQPKENLNAVQTNPGNWKKFGIDFNDYVFDVKGKNVFFDIQGSGLTCESR